MKKILVLFISTFLSLNVFAAGSDGGGSSDASMYDEGIKLVKRAGKLEKKDKSDKAKKYIPKLLKNSKKLIQKIKRIQTFLII